MKKFGFTLTEILVAMAVLGIIAVIVSPTIAGLLPDQDKIAVLKAYKIINDVHNDIKADPYLWEINTDSSNMSGWALHPNLGQNNVYGEQFRDRMQVRGDSYATGRGIGFDLVDGTSWHIDQEGSGSGTITIYLNDPNKQDCSYNKTNCTKPGRFIFSITPETLSVRGGDPLTRAYLANPNKLNDKHKDYATAASEETP